MASSGSERLLFVCASCRKPLELQPEPVQDGVARDFLSSYPLPPHLNEEHRKREKAAADLLAESFVVLPTKSAGKEAEAQTNTNWDARINALTKVFEVASDKCQIDHPICMTCTEGILDEIKRKHASAEADHETYKVALDRLVKHSPAAPKRPTPSAADEQKQQTHRRALEEQLRLIRRERALLAQERRQLQHESMVLDDLEARFWEEFQKFQQQISSTSREQLCLEQRDEVATEHLQRLYRTNVYDDAFHISAEGHFGTINGFRLGRLQSQQVDWTEINAALGQVCLLLQTLARHCNFEFTRYRILPMGSFSKMAKLDDPHTYYELYGNNDLTFSKLFWYRRFDTALVYLIQCIKEFGDFATKMDPSFHLRYEINDDQIQNLSIKLQFNQDAKWTKALKYMLTNLKYLLAWASKHKDH